MGVYFNKGAVKSKKEVQEQLDKMNNLHNDIVRHICNMENSKDYLIIRQLIKEYEGLEGVSRLQITDLYNRLYDGLSILLEDSQKRQENLSEEVEKIQQRSFVENTSTLKELNIQSDELLFQYQLQMSQNRTKEGGRTNRRIIGNAVKNCDRAHAIALSKLSLMPEYAELFTAKQREILPERAKSAQQRMYEEKKQADLETAQQKLSAEYMTGFHLKTAVKQMNEVINGSQYFGGGSSE
jgi:adenylosuccinate synthase